MKIQKTTRRSRKKIAIVSLVIATCIGLVVVAYSYTSSNNTSPPSNDSNTGSSDLKLPETAPDKLNTSDAKEKENLIKDDAPQSSQGGSGTSSSSDSSQHVVLQANQKSQNVTVVGKLYGISDGTCLLLISNNKEKFSDQAPIIFQPEYSSCAGFTIPVSKLGIGTWDIKLTAQTNVGSKTGTTAIVVK